jgi:fucose permease
VEEYYQSSYQSSSEYSIQSPDDIILSHDEIVTKKVEIIPTPLVSISATILCSIAYAISSASDTCTGDYMLTYVVSTKLSSEQNARFLHSAFYLSVCFGKLITIPLSKVLSPWKIILAYSVLAVGSVVVALMFYNQFILFGIGMILFGLFLSAQSPIIIGLPTTYVGMPVKGSVTSSILTTGKVGSTLVPLTVPFAIDVIGPTALLWTLLVLGTVAVITYP